MVSSRRQNQTLRNADASADAAHERIEKGQELESGSGTPFRMVEFREGPQNSARQWLEADLTDHVSAYLNSLPR